MNEFVYKLSAAAEDKIKAAHGQERRCPICHRGLTGETIAGEFLDDGKQHSAYCVVRDMRRLRDREN